MILKTKFNTQGSDCNYTIDAKFVGNHQTLTMFKPYEN